MHINSVNEEKCTTCLACVKECPPRLFSVNRGEVNKGKQSSKKNFSGKDTFPGKVSFSDPYDNCIHCGHCVSVCPHDAILYKAEGSSVTFSGKGDLPWIKDLSRLISYNDMLSFLRAKRSVRRYKEKPLTGEDIDAVLAAMQYAPTASNRRAWEYVVITDPAERNFLADEVISQMKKVRLFFRLKWLMYPFLNPYLKRLARKPGIENFVNRFFSDYEKGDDRLFFNAPCVVILHSLPYAHLAGNDAGIALTYGMLAAQTRGIGSCWIGYAQETFYIKKGLKKRFHIPRDHDVNGVMVMGYQDVTYYRPPVRGPLKVKYIGRCKQ